MPSLLRLLLAGDAGQLDELVSNNTDVHGTSRQVIVENLNVGGSATTQFTYSFWIKLSSGSAGANHDLLSTYFASFSGSGAASGSVTMYVYGAGSATHASIGVRNRIGTVVMFKQNIIPYDDAWHHVVVQYVGSGEATWKVYVDNALVYSPLSGSLTSTEADHLRGTVASANSYKRFNWGSSAGTPLCDLGMLHTMRSIQAPTEFFTGSFPHPGAVPKRWSGSFLPGEVMMTWESPNPEDDKSSNAYNFTLAS